MTPTRFGSFIIVLAVGLWADSLVVSAPVPKRKEPTTPFVKWTAKDEFVSNGLSNPLFIKDQVVVGTDKGEVRAYRCGDGSQIWTYQQGQRIFHRPCSDGTRIYFTSASGLTAVTTAAGAKEWSFDLACCDGPSLVLSEKGMVYVGGHDGNVYALDAKSGEKKWESGFLADAPPNPPNFPGARARIQGTAARPTALASDGETLFLSVFDQSRIVAINAKTGERLWSFQAGGWIYGAAVATETHVFVGSQDKSFYCLDKKTGKQAWKHETKARIESGGAVDKRFVYFGSCDGSVYCLKQADGEERWQFLTDQESDGRPSAIYSLPILHRGNVYFAAGEGQLYAVDCGTGKLKWKIRPSAESEMFCSPATDGTHFFVKTRPRQRGNGEFSLIAIGAK